MRKLGRVRTLFGAVALLAVGAVAQAAPAPGGHDQMLGHLIQDTAQGRIPYQMFTPELAAAVRSQAAIAQSELSALGALRSVTFESANAAGQEIYRTVFEKGVLEWAFSVNAQGLINNAIYRAAKPDPS